MKRKSRPPAPPITPELVREWLHYDPDTGRFTWAKQPHWWVPVGEPAESMAAYGYTGVEFFGRRYFAHRLAWYYVHGRWPREVLDHINRVPSDNRISNLREATHAQNMYNKRTTARGLRGTWFDRGTWRAQIMHARKNYHLGRYETQEQAHGAYRIAALFFQGEFANFECGPPLLDPPKVGMLRKHLRLRTNPLYGTKNQPPELRKLLAEYARSIEDTEMRALDELNRGSKIHVHIQLYEREIAVLDKLCTDNDSSRAAVIEALVKAYAAQELGPIDLTEKSAGRRKSRISGARRAAP